MKERAILHCDCNGFFASVELLAYPDLLDKPVVVGGDESTRHGIVLAKNEIAKKYGIKTAETLWQARNKCPDLIVLPPHHDLYSKYSDILNKIYNTYTDLVQPFGIDESWLDVTNSYHLFAKSPSELADKIRQDVEMQTGLTISVGVSFNKIFAKLGSDYKKPNATTVINKQNYKDIVFPLKVEEMISVGKTTKKALNDMGIFTIGELANFPQEILKNKFGKHGDELYIYANGLEDSLVDSYNKEKEVKSIGSGNTFSRNLLGLNDVKPALLSLSEDVGVRLRIYKLYANGVQITVKDPSFNSFTRQCKIASSNLSDIIYKAALTLLKDNWNLNNEIRALTVTAYDLSNTKNIQQVSFFDIPTTNSENPKDENLQKTLDDIRNKFGSNVIQNASILGSDVIKKNKKPIKSQHDFE